MKLGRRIRAFRRRYGLTQEEFARMIGGSRVTVNAWENERRAPRQVAILERVEEVLGRGKPSLGKKQKKRQGKKKRGPNRSRRPEPPHLHR